MGCASSSGSSSTKASEKNTAGPTTKGDSKQQGTTNSSSSNPAASNGPAHKKVEEKTDHVASSNTTNAATTSGTNNNNTSSSHHEHGAPDSGSGSDFKARYQLKGVLGNGNYSVVREAVDKQNGDHVAVKCIDKKKLTKEDELALKIETSVLSEIEHPNIIKLYGFYDEPKNYYIVTEFMQGGELFDRIVKKEYYSEADAQKVVQTLGSAIKYIHDRGIVHRDLKPENILMKDQKDDAAIKIADFGFARKEKDGLHTACGTPGYVAPEILKNEPYGRAVDCWSLGVIVYILLCGYPPFYNQNQAQLFQQIRAGQFEFDSPYWDPVSASAKDLIRGLLTVNQKDRLNIEQVLAHPWVNSSVSDKDLTPALSELKKFNARRKIRAGAKAALAAAAFGRILKGLGDAAAQIEKEKAEAAAAAAAGDGVNPESDAADNVQVNDAEVLGANDEKTD